MKERTNYMFTLVRQWRESGLTRNEFCMQHGVSLSKFGYWIAQWKEAQSGDKGGFIPMGSSGPAAGHSVLSVVYPNGVRLEVSSADLGLLSRLMFSLGSSHRYYLYGGHCDMRKSFDGLYGLVSTGLGRGATGGDVFVVKKSRRRHRFSLKKVV